MLIQNSVIMVSREEWQSILQKFDDMHDYKRTPETSTKEVSQNEQK